jgi:hypothetical protein
MLVVKLYYTFLLIILGRALVHAISVEDTFLQWFSSNGGVQYGISIATTETKGRGVYADKDIEEGATLLQVPKKLIVCVDTLKASNDPVVVELSRAFQTEEQILAAFLLLEKHRSERSFWKPYLDVLPEYIPNLLVFSNEELEALGDESLRQKALLTRARAERNYFDYLTKAGDLQLPEKVTLQQYFWARAVLDSRGLRFQGRVYLAPFTDMFNYEHHHEQRHSSMGNFFLKHHSLRSDGTLIVSADRAHSRGEEVVEDYGDNDDAIYTQYHGFVPEKNPFRCVDLPIPAPSSLSPVLARVLMRFGIYSQNPSTCVPTNGHLSMELVVYLAVSAMDDQELNQCAELVAKEKNVALKHCHLEPVAHYLDALAGSGIVEQIPDLGLRARQYLKQLIDNEVLYATNAASRFDTSNATTKHPHHPAHLEVSRRFNEFRVAMLHNLFNVYNLQDVPNLKTERKVNSFGGPSLEEKLVKFNTWFSSSNNGTSKLTAVSHPLYRVSAIASEDFVPEEVYLAVPTSIIIDNGKAIADPEFGILAKALMELFRSKDDFHELLFFLLHQRFIVKERSQFWPYLQLLPLKENLDVPLFWTASQIELRLGPSRVTQSAVAYTDKYRRAFDSIRNIDLITQFFPENILTFDNYIWVI